MRALAAAFGEAGFSVELPLLAGHGTSVAELEKLGFADWLGQVEQLYGELASRSQHVVVCGLSAGGALACALALAHPELAGLVLINPLIEPPAPSFIAILQQALEKGVTTLPSIGSDIARPATTSSGYDQTPIAPLLSLFAGVSQLHGRLRELVVPTLLFSSRVDHVVPPSSGDVLEALISGPIERVYLEHSYHVATLDNDAELIETRAVSFLQKVVAS